MIDQKAEDAINSNEEQVITEDQAFDSFFRLSGGAKFQIATCILVGLLAATSILVNFELNNWASASDSDAG